ncbi:MAG: Uma2 family endonuclease [Myxococcales bacterium]|nr:Uma2 family endonuclease [Myxococcales bacterium]MCB9537446.1 Uma2 family endonuclease [Myxococcales bacterium]
MSSTERRRLTEDAFLEMERTAASKHEFVNGETRAMPPCSPRHGLLAASIGIAVGSRLRGKPCSPVSSDVRVHVPDTGLYTYPDVTVVCGPPEYHPKDRDAITNPRVIFEVLSRSTEDYDRGGKFEHYRRITTLAEYVVVSQRAPHILHYRRLDRGEWLLAELGPDDTLDLRALECTVPLAEIYERYLEFRSDDPAEA